MPFVSSHTGTIISHVLVVQIFTVYTQNIHVRCLFVCLVFNGIFSIYRLYRAIDVRDIYCVGEEHIAT